jgi:isopenicillin-N N-acyltransferase like protein
MIGNASAGRPAILHGTPYDRGLQQAEVDSSLVPAVYAAVMNRIEPERETIRLYADFLAAQRAFAAHYAADHLAQIDGIAAGFGINADDLFAYLHLGAIEDAKDIPRTEEDGCSVVAYHTHSAGPLLAKNRDYRGEHVALQWVFLESDPDWNGRRVLSVGSMGSPGAFSSGMNSDGLALADTRIGWRRPNVGWLRYFLMNEILIKTATVAEALTLIKSQPHIGGGSLVLADAQGHMAAVELGGDKVSIDPAGGTGVGHTNHFLDHELAIYQTRSDSDANSSNSEGRLAIIDSWLNSTSAETRAPEDVAGLLASHATNEEPAMCRHGDGDGSKTISTTLFACRSRRLYFCPGNPCSEPWSVYTF